MKMAGRVLTATVETGWLAKEVWKTESNYKAVKTCLLENPAMPKHC